MAFTQHAAQVTLHRQTQASSPPHSAGPLTARMLPGVSGHSSTNSSAATGAAGARAQSPIWSISHFRNARRHSAAATLSRTRAIKSLKSSTQPCRRVLAPQAPCDRAMRSCRWGGVRRASGREMGSGAARVGGADPGVRGGRTRGTLKRRTGCPGSALRCVARPIPPHPRRPPPSVLDFNTFKIKHFSDLSRYLTAPHPLAVSDHAVLGSIPVISRVWVGPPPCARPSSYPILRRDLQC